MKEWYLVLVPGVNGSFHLSEPSSGIFMEGI